MSPALLLALAAPAWAAGQEPSEQNDITITEFMADPSGVPQYYGEWFEIYNNAGRNVDLQGLTITNRAGQTIEITEPFAVAIGDYIVFGVSDQTDSTQSDYNGGVEVNYVYDFNDFDLHASADSLEVSFGGTVIDVVEWDSSWTVAANHSEQVAPNAFDLEWANDDPINWCVSDQYFGDVAMHGTPGEPNEYCVETPGHDDDGDGWSEQEGDCDDGDPLVNPDVVDACTGYDFDTDHNCSGVRDDGCMDDDGDGWTEVDGDCDDTDSSAYPEARENPDDVDNDCNQCVDDVDEDGDGFGGIGDDGVCGEDCDDRDRNIYPGATEVPYDGIDQDCDDSDLCDYDGDNYDSSEGSCGGNDCDDNNVEIHPNAAEDPTDGIDNDCDGEIDVPDLDDDGYRSDEGDCMDEPQANDPDGVSASVHPGAPELCDGLDNDCDGFFDNSPDCAGNDATFATVRGGGLCGVAPASGGLFPTLAAAAIALMTTVRRRGGDA